MTQTEPCAWTCTNKARTEDVGQELEHDGLELRVRPRALRERHAHVLPAPRAGGSGRPEHTRDAVPAECGEAAGGHVRVAEVAPALRAHEEGVERARGDAGGSSGVAVAYGNGYGWW